MSNARILEAIEKTSKLLREQPEKARVKSAPAVATIEEGLRCRVAGPAGELIQTDMPPGMGGTGTAPNPGWFMRAALASCNATVIAMQAAKAGVTLNLLEVSVASESDSRGVLGMDESISPAMAPLEIRVRIAAEGVADEDLRKMVQKACARSPVSCTNASAAALSVQIG